MSMSALPPRVLVHRLRLTQARIARQWSQGDVAGLLGTTQANVSRWERGLTRPSSYFREKLCILFGKQAHELDLDLVSDPIRPRSTVDPALPPAPSLLVGREWELDRLRQLLQERLGASPVVLYGLPGVGKTTLALALAHDPLLAARFPDGILWAGLGPHAEMPELLARWGRAVGVSALEATNERTEELWVQRLRGALLSRSMLLIIDDAWSLKAASTLLVGGPNCLHLITTRLPLLAAQLTIDKGISIQELTTEESMTLLSMLAPNVVKSEEHRVFKLVQALGGLPLALKLVGNYLRAQSYGGQDRRIRMALESLLDAEKRVQLSMVPTDDGYLTRTTAQPTLSLRSIIAVTDQQLDEVTRKALYALSVFPPKPDTFSEEVALVVADCSVETLDTLVDAGLLESNSSGRYSLHQTISDYARLHLKDASVWQRFIAYWVRFVKEHKNDYHVLEGESSIIQGALHAAQQEARNVELLQGVRSFTPYLILHANYQAAQQLVDAAYEAALEMHDQDAIVILLSYKGNLATKRGDIASAQSLLLHGLDLARQLNNPKHVCRLLKHYGQLLRMMGDYTQAEALLSEGIALARQHGYQKYLIELYIRLGLVLLEGGKYSEAIACLKQCLLLARQQKVPVNIGSVLISLGTSTVLIGDFIEGEKILLEALEIARQLGSREMISISLHNLGMVAIITRRYDEAHVYLEEGLQLARQISHQEWIGYLLVKFAELYNCEGNTLEAERYLRECLPLTRELRHPLITCMYFCECGNLALLRGDIEAAETAFHQMQADKLTSNPAFLALAHFSLARVALARGNRQQARELGTMSLELFESIHYHEAPTVKAWLDALDADG